MAAETETASGAAGPGRGGRMSRQRKRDAVLRLLRGEDLETVSRSLGVTAAALGGWRDAVLTAGEANLATQPAGGDPRRAGRRPLPRRGAPEGPGVAAPRRRADLEAARAAANGPARPARTPAARPAPRPADALSH